MRITVISAVRPVLGLKLTHTRDVPTYPYGCVDMPIIFLQYTIRLLKLFGYDRLHHIYIYTVYIYIQYIYIHTMIQQFLIFGSGLGHGDGVLEKWISIKNNRLPLPAVPLPGMCGHALLELPVDELRTVQLGRI